MQVPNRYYNSPWIADAAANLTDAMFGNPQRDYQRLQQEHLQQQMSREQSDAARQLVLDARTDEDYAKKKQQGEADFARVSGARQGMVEQLRKMGAPSYKPTDSDYAMLASYAAEGGEAKLGDVMNTLGMISPAYLQKSGLLNTKETGLNTRNTADNDTRLTLGDQDAVTAIFKALLGLQGTMYTADAGVTRAGITAGSKTPPAALDITPTEGEAQRDLFRERAKREFGQPLDFATENAMMKEWTALYQAGRGAPGAEEDVWAKYMTKPTVTGNWNPFKANSVGASSLGSVVAPAATPAPAPSASASTPAPTATAKDPKTGKRIGLINGQWVPIP